ncbi:MAG: hypothetical protein KA004_13480 [Verrucomicrobiales bacterium]|nr:hypothetical protein [Verrucomicrobiales bacterium]
MSAAAASNSHRDAVSAERPWLGLMAFTEETQRYFFGREAEVRELYLRVREHPLTVLYGQSGLGKSSLLGAGLIPKLKVEGMRPAILRLRHQTGDPALLDQVRTALADACAAPGQDAAALLDQWKDAPTLWEIFHGATWKPQGLDTGIPVLVLDQFEEMFTLGQGSGRRGQTLQCMEQIADLVENRPPQALQDRLREERRLAREYDFNPTPQRIVITLREDYLSHLEAWKKSLPSLMRNRMALQLLSGPQAMDAVVKPGRFGATELISEEVGARIVCFVARRPAGTPLEEIRAVPPLLSLLCDELNEQRLRQQASCITAEQVSGQSADILQQFYEQSFAPLAPGVRQFVEDRMVTVGGHRTAVAREDAEAELTKLGVTAPAAALDQLITGRLLSAEERSGIQVLEISHDILAGLAKTGRDIRQEREQREAAEALAEKARRERSRLRKIALGAALLALTAVAGAIFGWVEKRKAMRSAVAAQQAEGKAEHALQQSQASEKATLEEKEKGERLLRQASLQNLAYAEKEVEANNSTLAFAYLAQALRCDPENRRAIAAAQSLIAQGVGVPAMTPYSEFPLPKDCSSVAFSPDGSHLLARSAANAASVCSVQLWNLATGKPVGGSIGGVASALELMFTADGSRFLLVRSTPERGQVAEVFSSADGTSLFRQGQPNELITYAQLSPDGKRLVTRTAAGRITVCDESGRTTHTFSIPAASNVAAVAPDGSSLAIMQSPPQPAISIFGQPASPSVQGQTTLAIDLGKPGAAQAKLQLLSLENGTPIGEKIPAPLLLTQVTYSPSGKWLVVSGTSDSKMLLIESSTAKTIASWPGMITARVIFSPDETWCATWQEYASNTMEFRQLPTGEKFGTDIQHQQPFKQAVCSPDGSTLFAISSGAQGFASYGWLWDVPTRMAKRLAINHGSDIWDAVFSANGRWLYTWGSDGSVARWATALNRAVPQTLAMGANITAVEMSPDGQTVAAAADNGLVQLWDRASSQRRAAPLVHAQSVKSLAFSPDGQVLATGSQDRTARLWNTATGRPASAPLLHAAGVNRVAFGAGTPPCLITLSDELRSWDLSGHPLTRRSHLALLSSAADQTRQSETLLAPPANSLEQATLSPDRTRTLVRLGGSGLSLQTLDLPAFNLAPDSSPAERFLASQSIFAPFDVSPNGRLLACMNFYAPELWDAALQSRRTFVQPGYSLRLARFSPDSTQLLVSGTGRNGDACQVFSCDDLRRDGFPLMLQGTVTTAGFSPDGLWIVAGGSDRTVRIWEVVREQPVAPAWFSSLLELLGGWMVMEDGGLQFLSLEARAERREQLRAMPDGHAPLDALRTWALADPCERPLSPHSTLSTAAHALQLAVQGALLKSGDSIRLAADLDPGCPLLHVALAALETRPERREFLRDFDMKRLPADAALRTTATALLALQGDFVRARTAWQLGHGTVPDDKELLTAALELAIRFSAPELILMQHQNAEEAMNAGKLSEAEKALAYTANMARLSGGDLDGCMSRSSALEARLRHLQGRNEEAEALYAKARPLLAEYFPSSTLAGAGMDANHAALLLSIGKPADAEQMARQALLTFARNGDEASSNREDLWKILRDAWQAGNIPPEESSQRQDRLKAEIQSLLEQTAAGLLRLETEAYQLLRIPKPAEAAVAYQKLRMVAAARLKTEQDPLERAGMGDLVMSAWRGEIAGLARSLRTDSAAAALEEAQKFLADHGEGSFTERGRRRQVMGLLISREELARAAAGGGWQAAVVSLRREMLATAQQWRSTAVESEAQRTLDRLVGECWAYLAAAQILAGDFSGASESASKGVESAPGPASDLTLVTTLIFQGRWESALPICEKDRDQWLPGRGLTWKAALQQDLSYYHRMAIRHPDMAKAAAYFNFPWPPPSS